MTVVFDGIYDKHVLNFLYCNTLYNFDEYFNYNKKENFMKIFNISHIVSVIKL
jgi:hypothetical protein